LNSLSLNTAVEENLGKPLNRRLIFTPRPRAGSKNFLTFNGDGYELPLSKPQAGTQIQTPFSNNTGYVPSLHRTRNQGKKHLERYKRKIAKNSDLSKLKMILGT
jgi:hypothetical protein